MKFQIGDKIKCKSCATESTGILATGTVRLIREGKFFPYAIEYDVPQGGHGTCIHFEEELTLISATNSTPTQE